MRISSQLHIEGHRVRNLKFAVIVALVWMSAPKGLDVKGLILRVALFGGGGTLGRKT